MTVPVSATKIQQLAFADIREVDPRLLVTAIAMMHLDTTHEVARTRLLRDDNLFKLHGKIAPLARRVRAARNQVLHHELQSVNAESAVSKILASRYVDDLAVSEADNQRFQDRQAWAAERGISLEDATKTIRVTIREIIEVEEEINVGDSADLETETVTATKDIERQVDRLVADQGAITRNIAKLNAYKAMLRLGKADNAHLRNAISQEPRIATAQQTLDEFGDRLPLNTLQNLNDAIGHFRGWSRSIAEDIRQHLVTARAVHDQMEKLIKDISENRVDMEETTREKFADDQLQEAFRKRIEKFVEQQRQAIPELLEALREAIEETEKFLDESDQIEKSAMEAPSPTDQKNAVS